MRISADDDRHAFLAAITILILAFTILQWAAPYGQAGIWTGFGAITVVLATVLHVGGNWR